MRSRGGRLGPALSLILAGVLAALLGACDASSTSSGGASPRPVLTGDPPTTRIPVILDTDLDLSDVAALAVLLRDPAVDVRAVTIVPTGTGVTNCASARLVTQYLLEEFDAAAIPFACGRASPGADGQRFPADWRGKADEGWGLAMTPRPNTVLPEDAVTLLARAVDESPSAPTIVALGPWTNLEDAVTADPALGDRIAGIHAMGGAIDVPGNVILGDVTAEDGLEWNLAADPSAVSAVFATQTPISLVPLDATDDVPIPADLADRLAEDHEAAGADLLYELLLRVPTRLTGEGQQLWDELAVLTLAAPDLVTWEEATLLADNAGRITRHEAGRPVRIATAADPEAVESALLAALRIGASRATPFTPAGAFTARWNGSACTLQMDGGLTTGVAVLTFENSTGDPAGVQIAGIREPNTWQELEALLPTLDVETAVLPDWVIDAGGLTDEAGAGVAIAGSVTLEPGTYGPVCITGTWPDLEFRTGQPFVVSAVR